MIVSGTCQQVFSGLLLSRVEPKAISRSVCLILLPLSLYKVGGMGAFGGPFGFSSFLLLAPQPSELVYCLHSTSAKRRWGEGGEAGMPSLLSSRGRVLAPVHGALL